MKKLAAIHSQAPALIASPENVAASQTPRLRSRRENVIDRVAAKACESTGTKSTEFADHILVQVAYGLVWPRPKDNHLDTLMKAQAAISEMAPQNATEAMLAAQMIACHDAAMNFLCRATAQDQCSDVIERNVLRATRLMRLFGDQLEAMQRFRGKAGQQRVTVEHVHVNAGGQAVVGSVATAQTGRGPGDND